MYCSQYCFLQVVINTIPHLNTCLAIHLGSSPDAFRILLQARMSGLEVEEIGIAMLDNRHRLLALNTLFRGWAAGKRYLAGREG